MSTILVFLQQANGKLIKGSLPAIAAAAELQKAWGKADMKAVTLGAGAAAAAQEAAQFGFAEVFYSEAAELENNLSSPMADAVAQAAQSAGADTVVASSTSVGKDIMPRVAVLLDAAQVSEVLGVNENGTLTRPMYAGDVIATVELEGPVRVVTVRQTAFQAPVAGSGSASITEFTPAFSAAGTSEFISREASGGERPELTDASVVVSGGRALQSAENFEKVIFPLADLLGAAVGASRAAVDSGYAPNDWQVGQTGKVVAPQLYISVGISGAIQHLAGMKDSKVIVAINKDPDAPIFEVADYGLVADLYQVVPELTEAIKALK